MTEKQLEALKALIDADRAWRLDWKDGAANAHLPYDYRGIEVNSRFGMHPKTADALVRLGLAETVQINENQTWIYLGAYEPYTPIKRD